MSDNILTTVDELFKQHIFTIPNYQRSYAWEEEQLEVFIEDLRHQLNAHKATVADEKRKPYFMGTLLLHAKQNGGTECLSVDVVDGQQRLTTLLIFIATALREVAEIEGRDFLTSHYIEHPEFEQKFKTIGKDNNCFRGGILGIDIANEAPESLSSQKLIFARDYFRQNVKTEEWPEMVTQLRNAEVLAYVIDNLSTATQIFEFQNDRGKKLTNLEAVKSFLMHNVHLNSKGASANKLESIHSHFESIFRDIEELAHYPRTPEEDNILSYHCAAFLPWTDAEYLQPKKLIKKQLNAIEEQDPKAIIDWINQFITNLKQSYKNVLTLYKKMDEFTEFSHIVILNRLAPFWPLLIKTYHEDGYSNKAQFKKACHLMELFSLRAYGLANLRSNAGNSHLLWITKQFQTIQNDCVLDFKWLFEELTNMCSWWGIPERMNTNLQSPHFYNNSKASALYILWRYENYLRSGNDNQNKWSKLSWRDIVMPKNHSEKLSLEHIAAQNNEQSTHLVSWNESDEKSEFKDIALHRLGNLVLDSISSNSSKQDHDFDKKWQKLSASSTYLSQGELKNYISPESNTWDVYAIKNRQVKLTAFIEQHWGVKA
jgi:hypothetical protein